MHNKPFKTHPFKTPSTLSENYDAHIIYMYSGGLEDFKNLINSMNQMRLTLKFKHEASKTSIDYLDLTIFKRKLFREIGISYTKVYTKASLARGYTQTEINATHKT